MNLSHMELAFSLEEIRRVVWDFGADKAPNHDSFLICFFEQHLSFFKEDLIYLDVDFNNGQANLERVNQANIVLILKKFVSIDMNNFWPIYLYNSSLKINSNILVNRVGEVINSFVDPLQLSFIKGLSIADKIVVDEEFIFIL